MSFVIVLNAFKALDKLTNHSGHNYEYNYFINNNPAKQHNLYCHDCVLYYYEEHDLYMYSAETEDYMVKCRDCDHSVRCTQCPEYYGTDGTGHWVSCPDGCYSFLESHTLRRVMSGDLYTHIVECTVCDYDSTESHTWVSYGTGYRCSVCKMLSDSPPIIMSLPDPELEAYLASLSVEEREEFIASLPEDQVDRVTALLPSDDEHLTE